MIYPKHLFDGSKIGVVALSAGVGNQLEDYKKSIKSLENHSFHIIETASVRSCLEASTTADGRAKELDRLVTDPDVDMIMCATGGDFLIEILPYVDYTHIQDNPKWFMGASDPTSLLFYITTALDIATMYGHNAGSYDATSLHESQEISIDMIKGNIREQYCYPLYESNRKNRVDGYALDQKVIWETLNGNVQMTGRIIGGCIDCLRDMIGTRFDEVQNFVHRYQEDGIIWYFDIFSLSSEDFYRTLLQMREAGWFQFIKGVVVGRVMFPSTFTTMTYQKALMTVFPNIPVVFNADIGHVPPKMTIINGSIAHIEAHDGTGKISFEEV